MFEIKEKMTWKGVTLKLLNTMDPIQIEDCAQRSTPWVNDPDINQYLGREGVTLQQSIDWYHRMRSQLRTDRSYAIWVDDRHVGNCGLHHIDSGGLHASVGIVIGDSSLHGQGIGTKVMHALARHALLDWELGKLWLHVFDHNTRGIACYEKVGYVNKYCQENHAVRAGKRRGRITMELNGDRYRAQSIKQ